MKKFLVDRKYRIVAGFLCFVLELFLLLGTGVLLENEEHFLSGEGSWTVALSEEVPGITQEFSPTYGNLESMSFCMDLTGITHWDSEVFVAIEDKNGQILYEQTMSIQDITDCAYTDIETKLNLNASDNYYFVISCTPTSAGEYPAISICGTEYELPESGMLVYGEEMPGHHMVSRYRYTDALATNRMLKAVLLCLATAFGIIVGLPRNKYVRKAIGVVLLIAAPYVLGRRLELLNYNEAFYLPFAMKWNIALMYALEFLVLLVTHSVSAGVVVSNVLLTIVYSANYFMRMYRGTSLRVNDLSAIGTVTEVVGGLDLTPNSHMAFVWAIAVIFVVFGVQTATFHLNKRNEAAQEPVSKRKIALVAASYVLTIALAVSIFVVGGRKLVYSDLLAEKGFVGEEFTGFQYELIYSFNGYLIGTCADIKISQIVEPEGYSIERVEEILEAADAGEEVSGELPHVILIMNESLADVRTVADVELNRNNMPFLDSMKENTIKGYANVSTYGGGTANSEFEVFTGCSVSLLSVNYYPYQQAMRRPVNSMVSQMEKYGYRTVAMHPEPETNWNRKNIYTYFGFDEKLFEDEFKGAEEIHSGVSDAETYHKMIEIYENRQPGEQLFMFDLTMQNHSGYDMESGEDEVKATDVNEPELDEFLSLIKISDEAFEDLVQYFEKQDEKVVICMFGDHQPYVFDLIDSGKLKGADEAERVMNKHRTPFVIWANYDIREADDYDISLNYLGGLLMETAGVPLSPYFQFLQNQCRDYPVLTVNGYVDKEGNYNSWSGNNDEFIEYRMLQYNYLFDEDTVEWGY